MDITARSQARARPDSFSQRDVSVRSEDSGIETESPLRRERQGSPGRAGDSEAVFRKPSWPASANRPDNENRQDLHNRRRNPVRDGARVPSGPREFPSPGKRVDRLPTNRLAPSLNESTNTSRSQLLPLRSSSFLSDAKSNEARNFSSDQPPTDDTDSPTTPAERQDGDFNFLPAINFDDFQTSIANYDGPLLPGFPTMVSTPAHPRDMDKMMANTAGSSVVKPRLQKLEPRSESTVVRTSSLKRFSAALGNMQTRSQTGNNDSETASSRNKSSSQGPAAGTTPSSAVAMRPPRKSSAVGSIVPSFDGRNPVQQSPLDAAGPADLARTSSLSKAARRTAAQPTHSSGSEVPRLSTFTAITQSHANRVKNSQVPPRDLDPNQSGRPVSKGGSGNRAHTPSSGNRRQSTISGRASGLGARTTSPTDTRRNKRLSSTQPPPVPFPSMSSKATPPQQDEFVPSLKPELPRLAQPSPSLIPRKTDSATPSSARASPEGRLGFNGGVTLNTKSSHQSLLNSSGSTSRLPTPKPRTTRPGSAQYGDEEEFVPPVPAIPKAYESPSDRESPFFSSSTKSYSSAALVEPASADFEPSGYFLSGLLPSKLSRTISDWTQETRQKTSADNSRAHLRQSTIENVRTSTDNPGPAKPARPRIDSTGRKNSNLQPLRLPPLNLMPLNTPTASKIAGLPRPSQEVDNRDDPITARTPEPKRSAKTPSTPMTASKATFWRRRDGEQARPKSLRSSSSQFILPDVSQEDGFTKFYDDSDTENSANGVSIPKSKSRNAITPFASGSLPKTSGDFSSQLNSTFNFDDEYSQRKSSLQPGMKPQGPRPNRSGTNTSYKTTETISSAESPITDKAQSETKKQEGSSGLRRKLSLNWRRGGSKGANTLDATSGSSRDNLVSDKEKSTKLQKGSNDMPPPLLPASASWAGDIPQLPRPSLESARRKSIAAKLSAGSNGLLGGEKELTNPITTTKTKGLASEQSQPTTPSNRSSSWGSIGAVARATNPKANAGGLKARASSVSISATAKDKDDLAADEEMRRLSRKRRDVDDAARQSEDLKARAAPRTPMSPDQVLHDRDSTLNIFERGEIVDYARDGIYFTGSDTARKIVGTLAPSPQPPTDDKGSKGGNYGYDDERGDYNIVLGDHLAYRYEVVDVLGKGSFGQVVRCVDHKEGSVVAVKIIRNKKRFHQQALVEVGILNRLKDWDPDGTHATLSIISSFYFRSHLCIVTPCLSINLYELIRAHNFTGFSLPLIRRFSRQLLACLVLLQNKQIIHCDLKPENILVCEARKADVRVIDFGSSCKEEEKVYTYIQSRFYRSPEVILGSTYGLGIDMWSLGCILAELWTGYPLFPGENEQEQLACIMEIFGPPDRHLVERCTRKKLFFDSVGKPRVTISSKGRRRRPSTKTLSQALKTEDEAFLDFITRCLRWDPDRRLKPHEAINHAFITNQPLSQRSKIPEEARRAARVRSTVAVPAAGTGGVPSPVKRNPALGSGPSANPGNAFAQQQQAQQLQLLQTAANARDRTRGAAPDTPPTVLRPGIAAAPSTTESSPLKPVNRRHSTVATAGAAAMAGSKRVSNSLAHGGGAPSTAQQRQASGPVTTSGVNLAQMAARESMSATAANAARWRN